MALTKSQEQVARITWQAEAGGKSEPPRIWLDWFENVGWFWHTDPEGPKKPCEYQHGFHIWVRTFMSTRH